MEMLKEMSMEELEKQAMKEIAEEYGLELIDENDDVLIGFITPQSLLQAIKRQKGVVVYNRYKANCMSGLKAYRYLHKVMDNEVEDCLCTIEDEGEFTINDGNKEIIIEF